MKPGSGQTTRETTVDEEWTPLPRKALIITLAGVMTAMFLAALDQTVVGTAMPQIIGDLGGFDRYTWVTTAYIVASTAVVPIVGRLSDMYGRKWFYIVGIVVFLLGSALSGISQSIDQLIFFRAFQGLGAGVMMANAFVAIGDLFPASERGKFTGLISGVFGLSSVVGPTLGGFITDTLSWHWVFYINIPLGIPVIALFIWFFPNTVQHRVKHEIDYLGMVTLILSVVPLLLGLSWGGVLYPWGSPQVIGSLVTAGVMMVAFVLVELMAAEPIIPLSLFKNPIVSIGMVAVFLTGLGMFGGIVFVPLFFQGVLGASATSSGSFLTPMSLGTVVGSIVSGQTLSRMGGHYRIQGLIGTGIMAVGMFLLSRMNAGTSYAQAVLYIVITGLGLGVTMPTFTIAVQNAVPYKVMGIATSSTQFFRMIGGTVGLAIFGSLMVSSFHSHLLATVPTAVQNALPPGQLEQLAQNPQALVSPDASAALQNAFSQAGPQGASLAQQFAGALRGSLAAAIADVFFVGTIAIVLSFVVTIFLKEIALKKANGTAKAPEKSSTPATT